MKETIYVIGPGVVNHSPNGPPSGIDVKAVKFSLLEAIEYASKYLEEKGKEVAYVSKPFEGKTTVETKCHTMHMVIQAVEIDTEAEYARTQN